jgi:hypothetical protein
MPPLVSPLNFWQVFRLDKALSQGHYQNWACTWLSITSCTLILLMPLTKDFKVYPTCNALWKFAGVNGRPANSCNAGAKNLPWCQFHVDHQCCTLLSEWSGIYVRSIMRPSGQGLLEIQAHLFALEQGQRAIISGMPIPGGLPPIFCLTGLVALAI